MQIKPVNNQLNFSKIYRKVHTRTPYLIQEIYHPFSLNNTYSVLLTGKTNQEINEFCPMGDAQQELRAISYERLIKKQEFCKNRNGNIFARLKAMEEYGYDGICKKVPADVLGALTSLKKETISALNDYQLYRICEIHDGRRSNADGLLELEKEFTIQELQRISERDSSTIINTWITKQTLNDESFQCLTNYIHELARK